MPTENVLVCPFCGGDTVKVICFDRVAHVECEDCGGRGPTEMNDDIPISELHANAIAAWNTTVKTRFVARALKLPED